VVRFSGGEVLITDGPFVESKEYLGGFYLIEAADLDAALGWASKVTAAVGLRRPVGAVGPGKNRRTAMTNLSPRPLVLDLLSARTDGGMVVRIPA
jgi:hypothetical protein